MHACARTHVHVQPKRDRIFSVLDPEILRNVWICVPELEKDRLKSILKRELALFPRSVPSRCSLALSFQWGTSLAQSSRRDYYISILM